GSNKLHILFGSQFSDDPHTWAYDLRKNEWRDMKPAVQPPTDRNDAALAYDSANRVVVAVVRAIDRAEKDEILQGHLETWAYDAAANTWTRMKPPREPDGHGNRRRIMVAVPHQNLILMDAFVTPTERAPAADGEQQSWAYRFAAGKPDDRPAPPTDLAVITSESGARLTWKPPAQSDGVSGYAICRGEGKIPWQVEFKRVGEVPAKQPAAFTDERLTTATVYHYLVRSVDAKGREGPGSPKGRTQPRGVEDAVGAVIGPKAERLG